MNRMNINCMSMTSKYNDHSSNLDIYLDLINLDIYLDLILDTNKSIDTDLLRALLHKSIEDYNKLTSNSDDFAIATLKSGYLSI